MSDLSDYRRRVVEPLEAKYRAVVAERDALAARLAEAERRAARWQDHAEKGRCNHFTRDVKPRGECPGCDRIHLAAAEARVAALTAELREALLSIEAYAEVGGVLVHETTNGWRLLAAADRPEVFCGRTDLDPHRPHHWARLPDGSYGDYDDEARVMVWCPGAADRPEGTTTQEGNA